MTSIRKRLRRADRWDWLGLGFALLAVFVGVASIITLFVRTSALTVLLLGLSTPLVLYVAVCLWFVGRASPVKPRLERDSLLWSWLVFLGGTARSGAALVVATALGALIGSILASEASEPQQPLRLGALLLIWVFGAWMLLVIMIWMVRAAVDVRGREEELKANLLIWLEARDVKKAKSVSRFLEDGATSGFIVLVGCALLLAILGGMNAAGDLLGVTA